MLSVTKYEQVVTNAKQRVAAVGYTPEKLAELSAKLDLGIEEHAALQTAKSLWQQQGYLDLELANHFYRLLGGTPSVFNAHDFVTKYVFLEVCRNLRMADELTATARKVQKSKMTSK